MSKPVSSRYLLLLLFLFGTIVGTCSVGGVQAAATPDPGAPLRLQDYTLPIRIACVGDSITEGMSASNGAATYPAVLGRLLGSPFVVANFGVSSTTMLKAGNLPYWNTTALRQVAAFAPDVVVVMLGTNDSKARNWAFKDQFARDAAAMVQYFRALPSRPRIWLCLPPPAYSNILYIQGPVIDAEIVPLLRETAVTSGTGVIDVHAALLGHPELLLDGVHPNDRGYELVAAAVYRSLAGAPSIWPDGDVFLSSVTVTLTPPPLPSVIVYTLDGSDPGPASPRYTRTFTLSQTTMVKARSLWPDGGMSLVTTARFVKAIPLPPVAASTPLTGLVYSYYEGDTTALQKPSGQNTMARGVVPNFVLTPRHRDRDFGLVYDGYIQVPADGMYYFYTASDDGSLLSIDGRLVVNNFRIHRMMEQGGKIALRAGFHRIQVRYYQLVGAMGLQASYAGPGLPKQAVPDSALSHESAAE